MSRAAARGDYKPGRAQNRMANRDGGARGRGAATKPLVKPQQPGPCSGSDCTCCSFETIESSASGCSDHAVALAKLKDVAARVDARNEKAKEITETHDYLNSEEFWMDNYWNDKLHRRAATIGEIYIRRGPPEGDDGAIFDMDL